MEEKSDDQSVKPFTDIGYNELVGVGVGVGGSDVSVGNVFSVLFSSIG